MQLAPIIVSQFRTRMRTIRSALLITAYAGVLLFVYFTTLTGSDNIIAGFYQMNTLRNGISTYVLMAIIQFAFLVLLTPSLTASAISGERERQTLDLLLCTRMNSFSIVIGKLISSMGFILLLLLSTIPMMCVVFVFGGIQPLDIAIVLAYMLLTALFVGSAGIFCSSLCRSTTASTVLIYLLIFIVGLGSLGVGAIQTNWYTSAYYQTNAQVPMEPFISPFVYCNPASGLVSLLNYQCGIYGNSMISNISVILPAAGEGVDKMTQELWKVSAGFMGGATLLFMILSSFLLKPLSVLRRPQSTSKRFKKSEAKRDKKTDESSVKEQNA